MIDPRRNAPATTRNRDPILDLLGEILPERGMILEIASGTGEHIVHFAGALPALEWQPSDPDPGARASIAGWVAANELANVHAPLAIDMLATPAPVERADAILCINMLHISPWAATEGLMTEAARLLPAGGPLFLYGPYRRAGMATAPSNEAFDASLRARDPAWGLRDLEAVVALAGARGLALERVVEMPANNVSVILRRE